MTKLNRVTGKIFGATASPTGDDPEIGQFGSAKVGTYVGTSDISTIQNLPAWSNGWIDAVTPSNQYPSLPERTGVDKVLSYQECYLLQRGIPEWDSATDYYENCFCSKNGSIYISVTDNNTNNDPEADTNNWKIFSPGEDFADRDLQNLTGLGNARLQYAPFAINAGTVINDNNHTLQSGSFIQSYTEAGSYTIEITEAGNYEVEMYGAGGGAANGTFITDVNYCATYGGASGAGYKGVLNLAAGNYALAVGEAGESNLSNTHSQTHTGTPGTATTFAGISAGGGTGATSNGRSGNGGTGGSVTIDDDSIIISTQLNQSGYSGSYAGAGYNAGPVAVSGGVSVYDGTQTGYGAGAGVDSDRSEIKAQNGYFKITKLTGDASKIFCDPCTITTCDGRTKVFDSASVSDVSSETEGNYLVFKNIETGDLSLISNLVISNIAPPVPSENDYWLDISTIPANLKQYNDNSWVINNDLVYIGDCIIANGAVSEISNREFNNSGYIIDTYSKSVIIETYQNDVSGYRIWSKDDTGYRYCEQWGRILTGTSNVAVTFLKPFKDTGYNISYAQSDTDNNYDGGTDCIRQGSLTTQGFIVDRYINAQTSFWKAEGYIN